MTGTFTIGFRTQRSWDWRIAFYLFTAGTRGGLIFTELVLRAVGRLDEKTATWGAWAGLILASVSLLVLFSHLGRGARWRFLNVFRRPLTSWLSRGAILVVVLMGLRILVLLPTVLHALPWEEGSVGGTVLRALVLAFAAAFMAYSGLVLSSWNSISFWNTPLLPALYVGYSLLGGVAALPLIAFAAEGAENMRTVSETVLPLLLALVASNAFALLLYVWGMSSANSASRESVRMLMRGTLVAPFLWGVVIAGLLVPLVLLPITLTGAPGMTLQMLFVSGVLILIGGYLLRYCVLRAGVYAPLM